jgi:hypothetical protein
MTTTYPTGEVAIAGRDARAHPTCRALVTAWLVRDGWGSDEWRPHVPQVRAVDPPVQLNMATSTFAKFIGITVRHQLPHRDHDRQGLDAGFVQ